MTTDTHRSIAEPRLHMCTEQFVRQLYTYREHSDFLRKESKLLVVEVVLEIDVNWSQGLWHITMLVPANQLQSETITYVHKNIQHYM